VPSHGPAPAPAFVDAVRTGARGLDPLGDAPELHAWLLEAPSTAELYAPAMLELADALNRLGYTVASTAWLIRIIHERADPVVVGEAVSRLVRGLDQSHEDGLEERILAPLDVAALPDEASRRVRLVQGLVDLKAGRLQWAEASFSKIPPGTSEAAQAELARLVTRVKRRDPAERLVGPFAALAAAALAPPAVRLEAQLALARLRYEAKDFTGALDAYQKAVLPPLAPGRASLYLEEAWASYRLGRTEDALSLLLTLDAPAFASAFLPDRELLRAQLFLDRCHYLGARGAARELLRRFDSALEAIRQRRELSEVRALRAAALARPAVARTQAYLERVDAERSRLAREGGALGERLTGHLSDLYATELGEAERVRDARLDTALEALAEQLLDAAEQARVIDYEVGMKLNAQLEVNSAAPAPTRPEPVGPLDVSYRFTGEYWNDELRDFRVALDDRCEEPGR
jgi:tetratricopeptide (TPR) repeat protein